MRERAHLDEQKALAVAMAEKAKEFVGTAARYIAEIFHITRRTLKIASNSLSLRSTTKEVNTMKGFLTVAFSIFLLLIGISEAWACSCQGRVQGVKGTQTCGYYWNSENVFIGTAEKLEVDNKTGSMKVTFSVERSVRGNNENTVEIFTSASTASCGYPFKQGERYFVYGRKGQDGKYHESLCGPTTLLKDAEDDLEYVKDIEAGKLGTRIFGNVFDDRQPTTKDKRAAVPLSGIGITIKSKKHKFRTLTDEKGNYLFKDIPKDNYQVFAELPEGYRELFTRQDLTEHFAGSCSISSFRVTRQGSLRGKVVNFPSKEIQNPWDGNTVQQPKIALIPLDENNQIDPHGYPEEKWAYRDKFEYYFDFVPAGNYLLAMNPRNCPYPNNGVPPTFFPGVADQSEATIITVKPGENLVLKDFNSLPLLKERSFSGTIVNADKSPAVNATVRLLDKEYPSCSGLDIQTKTDEFGRFHLKGFEGYGYKITAYAESGSGRPRYYAKTLSILQGGNVNDIQLVLDQTF